MNVGQILETHLGWSCSELGDQIKKYLKNFDQEIEKVKEKLKKFMVKNIMMKLFQNYLIKKLQN